MQVLSFLRSKLSSDFFLTARTIFSIYLSSPLRTDGGWSNGKAADSDSAYRGSSPRPPAMLIQALIVNSVSAFLFRR